VHLFSLAISLEMSFAISSFTKLLRLPFTFGGMTLTMTFGAQLSFGAAQFSYLYSF
jgi:hypothetical protein